MTYSKSFPRTTKISAYPAWEEITLLDEEEQKQEDTCRVENKELMKQCISDAKEITDQLQLKEYQSDVISIAKSLFDKRASHVIYHKEQKAKEKFDEMFRE